jgi:tRNA G18 (ribose-2'-O)-methylase SpoU
VTEVWMTEGNDPSPILGEIDRLAREAHVPVRLVSHRRLESVQGTEAPQGVVAFAEPLSAASLDELVLGWSEDSDASEDSGSPFDAVLDSEDEDDADEDDADEDDDGFFIELDDAEDAEDIDLVVLVDFAEEDGGEAGAETGAEGVSPDLGSEIGSQTGVEGVASEVGDEAQQQETPHPGITNLDAAGPGEDHATADVLDDAGGGDPDGAASEGAGEGATEREDVTSKRRAPDESSPTAFLVLLEGVTDPQNLGAILRSAECAGATGVAVPRHRSVHVTPAVTKAAAGAIEHLRMALVSGVPSALQALERLGVMTVGLDERGTSSLYELELGDRPVALVLGSEGSGLSQLARRRCDVLCRIPLGGELPSLNVSAAAAVACFEVARQRTARLRARSG